MGATFSTTKPENFFDRNFRDKLPGFADENKTLTLFSDKGMNSKENMARINAQSRTYFITTYPTCFADRPAALNPERFLILDIPKNHRLEAEKRPDDGLTAYRTKLTPFGSGAHRGGHLQSGYKTQKASRYKPETGSTEDGARPIPAKVQRPGTSMAKA